MKDKLLERMFDHDVWEQMIDKANQKEIDLSIVKQFCNPHVRKRLYEMFITNQLESPPTRMQQIPKDEPGQFRTVFIAEPEYRVIFALINHCLFDLFPDMVHPQCKSYRNGESCGKTVTEVSNAMIKLSKITKNRNFAKRYDFHKYFDKVSIDAIMNVFDEIEMRLGFEKNTEPVMNFLRRFYSSNLVFDLNGKLIEMYTGLRQGVAVSSFLADAILYELDDFMYTKYKYYWRYSDDLICFSEDTSEITNDINKIICKYGVKLNDKKTKDLYVDEFFKFLGFDLCKDKITLSGRRAKKLTKEIYDRTLAKPFITPKQAKENVKQYLYGNGDGYSWSSACFSALRNCDEDILVINNWIMDVLRLCEIRYNYNLERKKKGLQPRKIKYGWDDIGGIGVVSNSTSHTLVRGKGSKVRTARERTEKEIEHYMSVGCLLNAYKIAKPVYEACVRSI